MNESVDHTAPFLIFGPPLIEQPEVDEAVACMASARLGTGLRAAQLDRHSERFAGLRVDWLQGKAMHWSCPSENHDHGIVTMATRQ